jgi:hypothetical protein
LRENGHEHKAKMAFALYESAAADEEGAIDAASTPPVPVDDNDPPTPADTRSLIFCWIKNGIDADSPMGIPCRV